jgi:hypothetical protein
MKLPAIVLLILAAALPASGEDLTQPEAFSMILGPRIGGSYIFDTPENFSTSIATLYPAGNYFPVFTLFGITFEQRILLGETRSHFAFQEVVLVGGLEQGIALPEAAILIGYRDFSGFEFGIGPIVHMQGLGVLAALGWTFSYAGVFVPVDISLIIPNRDRPAAIAVTTGFNFEISRKEQK